MDFRISDYLARIGQTPAAPSPGALRALQAAQLAAIPFENIDPFLGILPDLDDRAIWRKLVIRRRGGYCLELNALFGTALRALGYDAVPVLGRVRMGAPRGSMRAHLAHVVRFGATRYLADVGFGGPAPEAPLEIGAAFAQPDRLGRFRLRGDGETGETVLERDTPEGWFALYGFDGVEATEADRIAANFFCARFPASPFPNHLMLNRVTASGRSSLLDLKLTTPEGRRTIAGEADLARVLAGEFTLDGAELAPRLWARFLASDAA
ncbi:MAG: arylamine N-acetyltransferase [Rhodobacteraceae bacterium]|nr:arylamine N-acetyltransferase [Paracoccaceae bacterium]